MSYLEAALHGLFQREMMLSRCAFPGCILEDLHDGEHRLAPAPPKPLSEQENRDRLAAAQTSYGIGTRSYNRSPQKKEIDRQCASATAKFLAVPKDEKPIPREWMMCRCPQRTYAHDLSVHRQLRPESNHPKIRENLRWPWSLVASSRVELSTERG